MRTIAAFLCLMVAASLAHAQAVPAAKPADSKTAPAQPADPKATPAKPGDPKAAPVDPKAPKKEVPLPKIPGTVINRANGTFLSLQLAGGNFTLTFYDKKHKPMVKDITRVTARWPNTKTSTPSDYRTVLNGSGTTLVGSRPVLPPYNFNVYLTLLAGEGDDAKAVETYTVQFRG